MIQVIPGSPQQVNGLFRLIPPIRLLWGLTLRKIQGQNTVFLPHLLKTWAGFQETRQLFNAFIVTPAALCILVRSGPGNLANPRRFWLCGRFGRFLRLELLLKRIKVYGIRLCHNLLILFGGPGVWYRSGRVDQA